MPDDTSFAELLARVRTGDAFAAEELVRRYELTVRVAIRTRLHDPGLRRRFDSMDVCQSVLMSFFIRAAAGQYDLAEPGQLVGLLVRMARNKLANQVRHHRQECRDTRRSDGGDSSILGDLAQGPTPERVVTGREMLEAVRAGLTEEERQIADRRGAGKSWPEIAKELGGSPEARRKQLARALDRLAPSLGMDLEDAHDR